MRLLLILCVFLVSCGDDRHYPPAPVTTESPIVIDLVTEDPPVYEPSPTPTPSSTSHWHCR